MLFVNSKIHKFFCKFNFGKNSAKPLKTFLLHNPLGLSTRLHTSGSPKSKILTARRKAFLSMFFRVFARIVASIPFRYAQYDYMFSLRKFMYEFATQKICSQRQVNKFMFHMKLFGFYSVCGDDGVV